MKIILDVVFHSSTLSIPRLWQPSHLNHHLKSEYSGKDIIQILEDLWNQSGREYPVRGLVNGSIGRCMPFTKCLCVNGREYAQRVPLPCQRSQALSALKLPCAKIYCLNTHTGTRTQ